MIDEEELDASVLSFYGASFGYERVVHIGKEEMVLFSRRETESEMKFRPKIVRRWVLIPRSWLFRDPDHDLLVLGKDGRKPVRGGVIAIQSSDGTRPPSEFQEQGITFRTVKFPQDLEMYVVKSLETQSLSSASREALGIPAPLPD